MATMESIDDQKKKPLPFALPDVSKIDISKISPKNSEPDYIAHNRHGRDFYGQAAFNTGVLWLGGYVLGGGYGFVDGWRSAANPSFKVRMNSIMNSVNKHGSRAGNGFGVVMFAHTACVHALNYVDFDRLTGIEATTPVAAGLITGALYKSTRGPRAAGLAAVIGAALSTVYWYGGALYTEFSGKGPKF